MTRRWIGYVLLLAASVVSLAAISSARAKLSPVGTLTDPLLGAIVIGVGLVAGVVGMLVWMLPALRLRRALRLRYPDAVVDNAQRDDFRDFIDVDALGVRYRDLPYLVTVVADGDGIAAWTAEDPGVPSRLVATIPWSRLGELEVSATWDTLPRYVVEAPVTEGPPTRLSLTFGGVLPRTYKHSLRTLDALRAVRDVTRSIEPSRRPA